MSDNVNIYAHKSWWGWIHRTRLKNTLSVIEYAIKKYGIKTEVYFDFGCCDGYVTEMIANLHNFQKTTGYEYAEEYLEPARKERRSDISFLQIDLTAEQNFDVKPNLVTCFEVLEHIGDKKAAVENLLKLLDSSSQERGVLVLSVPIESGFIAFVKFMIKITLFRRRYVAAINNMLNISKTRYAIKLLKNERMDKGNIVSVVDHFGFDHRRINDILSEHKNIEFSTLRKGTTLYYLVAKREG